MRIDAFLNAVNIAKRRAVALDMCKSGVISIDGKVLKPSREVKVGDILEIKYLQGVKKYRVLKIPEARTTSKSKQDEYIEEI
jgi:ribosomal 50S subunit-recycling heat shock protein